MKSRRRSIYYPPPFGIDLDRPPGAVAEVEIKFPAVICDPQIDERFRTVKQGFRFQQIQRGADGLRAGALAGLLVIGPQQEQLERTGADRTILPVAIDPNRSPAVLVGIVKEFDSRLEHQTDQSVRGGLAVAGIDGHRITEHMLDQVRFPMFLENPAP